MSPTSSQPPTVKTRFPTVPALVRVLVHTDLPVYITSPQLYMG